MARLIIIALCIGLTLFAVVDDSIALCTSHFNAAQAAQANNEIVAAPSAHLDLLSAGPLLLPTPLFRTDRPVLSLLMIMQC